jgi:hypothetical protein
MPSPFPGMDPYLEDPVLWPTLHQRLITYIGDDLNTLLPPHYVANIGERLYVVQAQRSIFPDVILKVGPSPPVQQERSGGAATATVASDPAWEFIIQPVEMREVFIEIRSVRDARRVVTLLEVLSPANKAAGTDGRRLYLDKQREVLESDTHLIEIDLLRQGEHTVAAPREMLLTEGAWDYLVCLRRCGRPERYLAWAFPLRERLPRICVPLAEDDPDVILDLQAIFDRCYDAAAYARQIDYGVDPPMSLPAADAEWARELLSERDRGMRG